MRGLGQQTISEGRCDIEVTPEAYVKRNRNDVDVKSKLIWSDIEGDSDGNQSEAGVN